ncbi:Retrovirus-related Pol polyprotein from transposon TNT 1-94 [Cucumis melo var. makuwa]|uniref:Retrovirus-related Pol polyprotein from transposon TNT 1-94 n=1 Tax=Cucumis melo var. makuwa TaxID=1194695 RepID=A0A5D3DT46_CUCMM|nr:Retrovirus-related Pol polyprotein from transposon TNT 1-94 [Cucumis melo var. makuwa]
MSMDVTFLEDKPSFLVSPLQRKSVSEEVNAIPSIPTAPTDSPVYEFEPTESQGTTELINNNLGVEDDIVDVVEEDKTNIIAPEENKVARNFSKKTGGNISPTFMPFTTSLDAAIVPKYIHEVMKSPEWKTIVTEEIGVLEKNKT